VNLFYFYFQKLTKGKDSWSLAEVVHAIVLLAHFHSLASFVFGCGVNEELDQEGGHQYGLDCGNSAKETRVNGENN
jgi:sestrin